MQIRVTVEERELNFILQHLALLQTTDQFSSSLLAAMHTDLVSQLYKMSARSINSKSSVTMQCEWEHLEILHHIDTLYKKQLETEKIEETRPAKKKTKKATAKKGS